MDKSTSAWLNANPAFFANWMNDAAFQISFGCFLTKHCQDAIGMSWIAVESIFMTYLAKHISAPIREAAFMLCLIPTILSDN
jgi:hypothetical protein